ncbi:MAG: hypothetical protein Q9190_003686 [Brigantiaea leucoxantha]
MENLIAHLSRQQIAKFFLNNAPETQQQCNEKAEAITVDLAKRYGDAGVPLKYVAIVTPYKSQSRLLMHYLHRSGLSEVAVSSLDAFQGDERTVIIFSFAGTEGPGFMADPRRLLVSMTHAGAIGIKSPTPGFSILKEKKTTKLTTRRLALNKREGAHPTPLSSTVALVKASIQQEVNKQKLRSQEWETEQVAYIEKMGELNTSCNEKDTRINAR